ncbi:hypothetical protein FOL47_008409 [Perkinsus chesapeaki]|uniref:Integral membrane bound transporter domain-containing protein n=1 Tax=Perkinsus chesapeaki TaxID=330153 RepID=A0A7J6LE58_PERCH|nr:hypothetical protein FOL47_008409 [Perkinsus chesapeaki]
MVGGLKVIGGAVKKWLKRPLFNDLHGYSDLISRMRIPVRTALSMSIVCTMLVLWGNYSENVRLHGFWAVIPQYVLYLPTAGATLLKGTKRIIGTLLGGALAVLCLYLHPDNMAAFLEGPSMLKIFCSLW